MKNVLKSYCVFTVVITQVSGYTTQVKLSQGKIIGTREETIFGGRLYYAFYGVPYAQPPVGKLRFKDPKRPKKWKKPFDATVEYRGACAQAHIVHKHALHGVEDCLYLNIYTPMLPKHSNFKLKPVLMFVHGYTFASSLSHIYGGDFMVDEDIIFVSVTHRIGVFGFLKVNDSNPDVNMGLKDIVMALKFIRREIKHFGGDKNAITVMGNDSGATFLSLLLMTKYKRWISKVILQSGAIFSPSLFQNNQKIESQRLKANLRKMGIKDILSASTNELISASQKIYNSKEIINFQKPVVPFTPVLEKKSNRSMIVNSPDDFYKKHEEINITVPILIGFTSRESIPEMIPFIHNTQYLKSFSTYFKFMVPFSDGCMYNYTTRSYKKIADKIKGYYFNNDISEKSLDEFIQYTTDLKIYPIWKFIQSHLNSNQLFVYKFNYVGRFNAVKATSITGSNMDVKGASNGDELCYILKCEPLWENYVKIHNNTKSRDRKFIVEMTKLWANFVKTGNPTPNYRSSSTVWPPISSDHNKLLHIGRSLKVVNSNVELKMFQFWNDIYNNIYSKSHCTNGNMHEEL